MCFVWVFAALLEFATVNNTFWEKKSTVKKPANVPKNPKIEISKPKSDKIKKSLEVVGLPMKDRNVRRPPEIDSLCTIEVVDNSLPTVGRIPRSTSFSGVSGVVPQQSQNLYVSPAIPVVGPTEKPPRPKVPWKQRKFVQAMRKRAKELEKCLPDIRKDVNIIDKYSRVAFPVSFIIFNIMYWGFYHDWDG